MTEEIEPMPKRMESLKHIAVGVLPHAEDWDWFCDAVEYAWKFVGAVAHLALRAVMVLCYPLTLLVLFPLVRRAQWQQHRNQVARRKEMLDGLTMLGRKPDPRTNPLDARLNPEAYEWERGE